MEPLAISSIRLDLVDHKASEVFTADTYDDLYLQRRRGDVKINLGHRFWNPNFKDELEDMASNACHKCLTLARDCSCPGKFRRKILPGLALEFSLSPAKLEEFQTRYPEVPLVHCEGDKYRLPPQRLLSFLECGHRPSVEAMAVLARADQTFLYLPRASREHLSKADSHDAFAKELFNRRIEGDGLQAVEAFGAACQIQLLLMKRWGKAVPTNEAADVHLQASLHGWEEEVLQRRLKRRPQEVDKNPTLTSNLKGFGGSAGKHFAAGAKGIHINVQSAFRGEGMPTVEVGPRFASTVLVRAKRSDAEELFRRGALGPEDPRGLKQVVLGFGNWKEAFDISGGSAFREELEQLVQQHVATRVARIYCGDDRDAAADFAMQAAAYLGGASENLNPDFKKHLDEKVGRRRGADFVVEIGRPLQTGDVALFVRHPVNRPMQSMRMVVNERRHDLCIGSCGQMCQRIEGDYDGDGVKVVPAESAARAEALSAFDLSELFHAADGKPVLQLSGAAPAAWSTALRGGELRPPEDGAGSHHQVFSGAGELRFKRADVDFSHCGLARHDLIRPELFQDATFEVELRGDWFCPAEVWRRPQQYSEEQRRFAACISDDGKLPVERAAPPEPQLRALLRSRGIVAEVRVLRLENSVLDDFGVREQISLQLAFHSLNQGQAKLSVLHAPHEGLSRGAVLLRQERRKPLLREAILGYEWRPEPKQLVAWLQALYPRLEASVRQRLRGCLRRAEDLPRALSLDLPAREAQALRRFCHGKARAEDAAGESSARQLMEACNLSLLCKISKRGEAFVFSEGSMEEEDWRALAEEEPWSGIVSDKVAHEEPWIRMALAVYALDRPLCCPSAERLAELHAAYPDKRPRAEAMYGLEHLAQTWVDQLLPEVEARHVLPFNDDAASECFGSLLRFERRMLAEHVATSGVCAAKARADLTLLLKDAARAISVGLVRGRSAEGLARALATSPGDVAGELEALMRSKHRLYLRRNPQVRCSRALACRNASYSKENAAETGLGPVVGLPGLRPTVQCSLLEEGAITSRIMAVGYPAVYGFVLEQQSHAANKDGKTPLSTLAGIRSTNSSTCSTLTLDRGRVYAPPVDERLCLREMPDGLCGERCYMNVRGLTCDHCGQPELPRRKLILPDAEELAVESFCRGLSCRPTGLRLLRGQDLLSFAQASVAAAPGYVHTSLPAGVLQSDSEFARAFPGIVSGAGPWNLGPDQYVLVKVMSVAEPPPRCIRSYGEEGYLKQALDVLQLSTATFQGDAAQEEAAEAAEPAERMVCCLVEKPVQATGDVVFRLEGLSQDISMELAVVRAAEEERAGSAEDASGGSQEERMEKSESLAYAFDLIVEWAPETAVLQQYGAGQDATCACGQRTQVRALRTKYAVRVTTMCRACVAKEAEVEEVGSATVRADDRRFALNLYRYLAEMISWGFAVRPGPTATSLSLEGSFADCMALRSSWDAKKAGEPRSLPSSVLVPHYSDLMTHNMTTQRGRVGTIKRPHAQAFRVGDFDRLRKAPRAEVVEGFRDSITL